MRFSLYRRRHFPQFRRVRQWHRVLGEVAQCLFIPGIFKTKTRQSHEQTGVISELTQL